MRKKLVSLVAFTFILCMVLTNTRRANASTPTFAVQPASIEVPEPGQTIQVNITVTDSPSIVQWALNITWNPDVLDFVDIIEGNFLKQNGSTMFLPKPAEPGKIPEVTCLLMVDKVVSGNGTLCTITFNATAVGESNINIDWGVVLDQYGNETEATLLDGTTTVVPEFPASMLLPLFLGATTIAIIAATVLSRKRRIRLNIP